MLVRSWVLIVWLTNSTVMQIGGFSRPATCTTAGMLGQQEHTWDRFVCIEVK